MFDYTPFLPESLLYQSDSEGVEINNHMFKNFSLKSGVILRTHEIDSKDNLNKSIPEYDVVALEQVEDGGTTTTIYKNAIFIDSFGGQGDFFEAKRRSPSTEEFGTDLDLNKYDGSLVLLLCIDGISEKPLILSSIPNPNRKNKDDELKSTTLTPEAGHHMEGEFNGLNWQVNKDGELTITFNSPTDNKGLPILEEEELKKVTGSFVKLDKTGSIHINDGGKETIVLDRAKKTISIAAEDSINITATKNVNIKSTESTNITATKDLIAMCEGKANLIAKGSLDIQSEGDLKAKAKSGQFEIDGAMKVKAPSVEIESDSVQIKATSIMLGSGGTPALIQTTQFLGTGNFGVPVISTAVGPFSTTVLIGS